MPDYAPIETYGCGYILFTHIVDVLQNLGGQLEVRVVKLSDGDGGNLAYALFYKGKGGKYFDVLQQRNALLKTFSRADTLILSLTRIGLDNISVPALISDNVLKLGELGSTGQSKSNTGKSSV